MKISKTPNVQFTAYRNDRLMVKKYNPQNNNYDDIRLNFVEFDPMEKNDRTTVYNLLKTWSELDDSDIIFNYDLDFNDTQYKHLHGKQRFFALTEQTRNFQEIDHKMVKGIIEIGDKNKGLIEILSIQTDPKILDKTKVARKYKDIGSAMIRRIQELYPTSVLEATVLQTAEGFFEKLGFNRSEYKKNLFYLV